MNSILEVLTKKLEAAFEEVSYDKSYATVGVSNRPDLCEFQCNGAMSLAKLYKKKPLDIAIEVVEPSSTPSNTSKSSTNAGSPCPKKSPKCSAARTPTAPATASR